MTKQSNDPKHRTSYPTTRRDDSVVDVYHGTEVRDPYRWLEDPDSPEVRAWAAAQNELAFQHLETIPQRNTFRKRLADIWNEPTTGAPWRRGPRWFEFRNDGVQNQDVLFVGNADAEGRPPAADGFRPLLDVNPLSSDGTTSLNNIAVTPDGELLAYGLSEAGSDWTTWKVREIATGRDLPDVVPWSKFGSAAWLPDGSGFFYTPYDAPAEGTEYAATNQAQKVRLHILGTPTSEDRLVHEEPDHPDWTFEPYVTHDGRWFVLSVWTGGLDSNWIYLAPIENGAIGSLRQLIAGVDAHFDFVGVVGGSFVFVTNHEAPKGRVIAVEPGKTDSCGWQTLVPESDDRLDSVRIAGAEKSGDRGWLVLHHWRHATSQLSYVPFACGGAEASGAPAAAGPAAMSAAPTILPLPEELSSVLALSTSRADGRMHVQLSTFPAPNHVYYANLGSESAVALQTRGGGAGEAAPPPDRTRLLTRRVFVEHDSVRLPVFLLHREDVHPDGKVPTILYGYGGFDISMTPGYSVAWRTWVEHGGLVAVACLRGGGEYGKAWHDAGRTPNKQNVFDDAAAVGEWLCEEWTCPARLGITGRSNGGLLAAACLTQRPDLFGAAVPEVGVLDMLRFHRFTIGWAWVNDYGSADDATQFRELYAYSPLHNLKTDTCYPPTMITTGDHDDRVVPAHSYKFAAALQYVQSCDHPALIRIDTSAGHGMGKPLSKRIEERADVLAFFAQHLGF
ncbi:MAG: prolyl oligopeptidase family serine peptidase [Candidatus Eisenbacteria bacterium]